MNPGRPLSEGNRLQRAYHRWALPYYERMAPELRAQSELIDRFLYSGRGLGFWAGLLAAVVGSSFGLHRAGMPWLLAVALSLLLWAALPLTLLAAWLQPALFSSAGLRRKFPRIIALASAGALLGFTIGHVVRRGSLDPEALLSRLWSALGLLAPAVLLTALALAALMGGVARLRRQMLERELQQARLQQERDAAARQAAEARLKLLQGQIQPHFIFNTLSAVQHWVDSGDPRGGPLLHSLTAFLRSSTEALGRDEVTLEEEAAMVRHYLAIMQARLGERLRVELQLETGVAGQRLPPGLVLTLVENAVEHGIAASLAGGLVRVRCGAEGADCVVTVSDSAGMLAPDWLEGVGLSNCRERLAQRFDGRGTLTLRHEGGCTVSTMRLPLRQTDTRS